RISIFGAPAKTWASLDRVRWLGRSDLDVHDHLVVKDFVQELEVDLGLTLRLKLLDVAEYRLGRLDGRLLDVAAIPGGERVAIVRSVVHGASHLLEAVEILFFELAKQGLVKNTVGGLRRLDFKAGNNFGRSIAKGTLDGIVAQKTKRRGRTNRRIRANILGHTRGLSG